MAQRHSVRLTVWRGRAVDSQPQVTATVWVARVNPFDRAEPTEQRLDLVRETVQPGPIVAGRLDPYQAPEQVDHLLPAWL